MHDRSRGLLGMTAAGSALAVLLSVTAAQAGSWVWVSEGTELSYFKGTTTPPASWNALGFAPDAAWTSSPVGFGIGYGDSDDNTLLSDMLGSYLTVYVRAEFSVGAELGDLTYVELSARYDDGFAAYLNGVEIGRANLPAGVLAPTTSATAHEVTDGDVVFPVDVGLLRTGTNVLAVEVHNQSTDSSDLSFIPTLWGYDTPPPSAVITRGPFVQQVGRERGLVVWETSEPAPSEIWYGDTTALALRAEDPTLSTHHVVPLTGLRPNQAWFYQVQSAQVPSAVGRFVTEVNRADPFVVGVFGDTRSGHADHRAVVSALAQAAPHLGFNTGDLVANGSDAALWDIFCEVEAVLARDVALYPALGNHEGTGSLYLDLFELPADSPSPERYYTVHYGTVLGIVLDQYGNDYDLGSEQATWLEQVLSDSQGDPNIRHRLVFFHHGPYDSGSHGSNLTVRSALVPLFEQYGVGIVFSGHDHDYERGTVNGVKYVVTGGGGAELYSVSGDTWTEVSASVHHYCTLAVHGPRLELTAYELDGTVLDAFVLGEGLAECTTAPATECASFPAQSCADGELGEWVCVEGGCIWNCVVETPEPPDGGAGGSGASAGGSTGAGAQGATGGAGVSPGASDDEGGCGCRVGASASHGWLAGGLGALGAALLALRRRSRRP